MKKIIFGLVAALVAAFTLASPTTVGATGGTGNAAIYDVNVTCAAPDGTYQVTWVAYVTRLNERGEKPTTWSINGQTASVLSPIVIVTTETRQRVLYSAPARIAVQAYIGYSRPILTDGVGFVPGYCI